MKKINVLVFLVVLLSCKKKEDDKTVKMGELKIQFQPKVANQKLNLGSKYVLSNGDSLQISTFKCYFSNFYATSSNQLENKIYYLYDASQPTKLINWNMPVSTYSEIGYSFGIDSIRNHSGEQTGDLDPKLGLIWSWGEGYKFLVMQGKYFKNKQWKTFSIEVGGDKSYKKLKTTGLTINEGINQKDISIEISTIIKGIDLHVNQSIETLPLDNEIANNFSQSVF